MGFHTAWAITGHSAPVIPSIEDPLVLQKILSHLNIKNDEVIELLRRLR